MSIIGPARSHPGVIIAAVAARNEERANAYAKKHGIPIVHKSYQGNTGPYIHLYKSLIDNEIDLIDDPSIDAIYIPLPNGLHYEWTIKSLKAKKHVLLEKPSTSTGAEAASLFRHPLLAQPNAPVLLEAFHSRFHPAAHAFLSYLDPANIVSARTSMRLPKGLFPNTDIRFIYDVSGGATMDVGTYAILFLRLIFGTEPTECLEATPRLMPEGFDQKCDQAMKAKWQFPNGGTGEIDVDLSYTWLGLPGLSCPKFEVVHKELRVEDAGLGADSGEEHVVVRTVVGWNIVMPFFWHRIDITEQHTIRHISDKMIIKTWTSTEHKKAYTWQDSRSHGEASWTTYRHQLEQFVRRVKTGSASDWMEHEDSVSQMEMIDSVYKTAGLPLRPMSAYRLE